MTIREMIDAMLAGKTLIRPNGATAYYDPDDANCGPWVYVGLAKARMVGAWYYTDWSVKPKAEPKIVKKATWLLTNRAQWVYYIYRWCG